jgi:hypothetical protein
MDSNAVANLIAGFALILSGITIYRDIQRSRREQEQDKRRAEWEREQERKRQEWERLQLNAAAPRLIPVHSLTHVEGERAPQHLTPTPEIVIFLHNGGSTVPFALAATLFPATFINPHTHGRTDNLYGIYWEGRLDVSPVPNKDGLITLHQRSRPLHGEQSLIEGFMLFAPDEPAPRTDGSDRYYVARLTLSFRDATERTLAMIYDAETVVGKVGLTTVWNHVAGPVEVSKSLQELIEETGHDRDEAEKPF